MTDKHSPTVSIAMTTYNGESFLKQQIDSIFQQSYQDFELIICDDCSHDNTLNIIHCYMKKYSNIKLYKNSRQLGSVKNFEQAIMLSHGKYIALSDQDDIWHPDKLTTYMNILKKNFIESEKLPFMLHSDLKIIDKNNILIHESYLHYKNYQLKKEKDLAHILGPCGVMGNTIIMNQALKEKILPFPTTLAVHDYWIALVNELTGKRISIDESLISYRIHHSNLSNSTSTIHTGMQEKLKRILTLDFTLPYIGINRDKTLHYLLQNYHIAETDKILIKKFITYLELKENKLKLFIILVRYNFIKKGFFYRWELLIKLLFTRRYNL